MFATDSITVISDESDRSRLLIKCIAMIFQSHWILKIIVIFSANRFIVG